MNLVIDDAVEVHLATRDAPEKRRQLGNTLKSNTGSALLLIAFRTNSTEGRQCVINSVARLEARHPPMSLLHDQQQAPDSRDSPPSDDVEFISGESIMHQRSPAGQLSSHPHLLGHSLLVAVSADEGQSQLPRTT